MNEIITKIIIETLEKHDTALRLLIYGFGGVIFKNQFKEITGEKNDNLVNFLVEHKFIKTVKLNKNTLLVARYKLYSHFGLKNKSSVCSGKRILHSSLYAEILIRCHSADERYIKKSLHAGTVCYYAPEDALNLLTRVEAHAQKHGHDTQYLSSSIDEMRRKVEFCKSRTKGNKDTLNKSEVSKETKDILVLKDNGVYVLGVNYDGEYIFDVGIFAHTLRLDKVIRQIQLSDSVIKSTFYGLPVKINITVYSHFPENKGYSARTEKILKEKNYSNTVKFIFFDSKRKLFSGIDINKWL